MDWGCQMCSPFVPPPQKKIRRDLLKVLRSLKVVSGSSVHSLSDEIQS